MIRKLLVRGMGASLAAVFAMGLGGPAALAMGNSISETGPGSVNVIYESSSNYSSNGYGGMSGYGGYRMMQQCGTQGQYGGWSSQSQGYQNMCNRQHSYGMTMLYMMSRYAQHCDHSGGMYN